MYYTTDSVEHWFLTAFAEAWEDKENRQSLRDALNTCSALRIWSRDILDVYKLPESLIAAIQNSCDYYGMWRELLDHIADDDSEDDQSTP
jgi:hypothetical protein